MTTTPHTYLRFIVPAVPKRNSGNSFACHRLVTGGSCLRSSRVHARPLDQLTLPEAVQMALKHNHMVRIAGFQVEEKQHAKDVARSGYFPTVRNETRVFDVTDSQFIQIAAGSLGTVAGSPIPERSVVLNQGGKTFVLSGTTLTQPLTQLFSRVKPANDAARDDLNATRANAHETENEVALKVHQLYYRVLIAQLHRSACREARSKPR